MTYASPGNRVTSSLGPAGFRPKAGHLLLALVVNVAGPSSDNTSFMPGVLSLCHPSSPYRRNASFLQVL